MGFLLLVVVGPGCACPLSESTRSQFLLEGSFRQLLAKGYSTILNVQFPSFAGHQFQQKLCPGRKQILEVPRRWLCDNSRSLAVWRNVFHKRPSSSRSTVVGPCSCGKFRVVARTENRFLGRFCGETKNKQVFCGGNLLTFHGSVPLQQSPSRKRVVVHLCKSRKKSESVEKISSVCRCTHTECELKQIEKLIPIRRLVKSLK